MSAQPPWDDPNRPRPAGGPYGADPYAEQAQDERIRPTGFPFPGLRGTTRGGTSWRVGGCCLPIPIGCMGLMTVLATIGAVALPAARRRRPD